MKYAKKQLNPSKNNSNFYLGFIYIYINIYETK